MESTFTPEEIISLWENAEKGDLNSLMALSVAYNNANGVSLDPEMSFRLIEKAMKMNNAEAFWRYGYHIYFGIGCPADTLVGREYIQKAIDMGDGYAKQLLDEITASES